MEQATMVVISQKTQYVIIEVPVPCSCCSERLTQGHVRPFDDTRHLGGKKQGSDGEFAEVMMTRLDRTEKLLDDVRQWCDEKQRSDAESVEALKTEKKQRSDGESVEAWKMKRKKLLTNAAPARGQ